MKRTPLDVYGLCRDFICDNAPLLGAVRSEWLIGLVRSRDLRSLSAISSHPRARISNPLEMKFYLQVEAFFKKNSSFTVKPVARQAAIASFDRGETICRITNRRLDHYYSKHDRLDPDLRLLVERTAQWVERILGDFSPFLDQIPDLVRLTSGASASHTRKQSAPVLKMRRTVGCYPGTVPYLKALLRHYGLESVCKPKPAIWNRVEFVAKNWKTDRTIACEQEGSLPFQLAFDSHVKSRLKRFGVDLSNQSVNQEHARQGSIDGDIATIDLSMASDTLAYNTVAWLLPKPWYDYVRAHRASHYSQDGNIVKYAKFSSMGNGCTFGLETLVFLAMVRASGCKQGVVYGDDITVHRDSVPNLMRLLRFFGFVPNVEKSCFRGPYRESCGKHFFNGTLVTPFYVRSVDEWDDPNSCHNVNGLAQVSAYGRVWTRLQKFCKQNNLLLTPYQESSTAGVWISPHVAHRSGLFRHVGGGTTECKTYIQKSSTRTLFDVRALLLWHLRAKEERHHPSGLFPGIKFLRNGDMAGSYTLPSRRFVRKWKTWNHPGLGEPEHLFGLSEVLVG